MDSKREDQADSRPERTGLALRRDLVFTPELSGRDRHYRLEDPINSKFYRLGLAEYAFVSLLDGHTSIGDALRLTAKAVPDSNLAEHDAATISRWLVQNELAHPAEPVKSDELAAKGEAADGERASRRWNPLIVRLPLLHPDRLLAVTTPWFSWAFSPVGWAVCVVITLLAASKVAARWDRFAASCSEDILAPHNWLWLGGCWLLLKLIHEFSHAVVCKKYGGFVREAGVIFVLFAPLAYVDATSSWRFRSKWQRIHTAIAGMYVEAFIASFAALLWCGTSPGLLNHLCGNIVVMAGVTTVLFNANPLMKFDGYFILSDWLGVPNLYANAQQCVRHWLRKNLWGVAASSPPWSGARRSFFLLYGAATLVWRLLVSVSLVLVATTLFHGAGVVLAGLAFVLWFATPAVRFAAHLLQAKSAAAPHRARFLAITVGGLLPAACGLAFAPWPAANRAPAIVEYSPLTVVRAASSGFVGEVRVRGGQLVQHGQVLAVLSNEELELELEELDLLIQQSHIKSRMFEQDGELAAQQAELKSLETLEQQRREKQAQVEQLVLTAPRGGRILTRRLDTLVGAYRDAGDELLSIGDEQHKELLASLSQDDIDTFTKQLGKPATARLPGGLTLESSLQEISPRASLAPTHASLCAAAGGPLPVRNTDVTSGDARARGQDQAYELLTPRFTATFTLSPAQSSRLIAGQRGAVALKSRNGTVGGRCYDLVASWVRKKLRRGAAPRS